MTGPTDILIGNIYTGINSMLLTQHAIDLGLAHDLNPSNEYTVVGNHSGYGYKGSENFEHDNTGGIHNYSSMEDQVLSAFADHEDWQEGYDF